MDDEERPETIDETFERVEARARGEREKRREKNPASLSASVGDLLYHDFQPCTNPEHATAHCGFWNYLMQAECGRFAPQHRPAPPWNGSAPPLPLTDEELERALLIPRQTNTPGPVTECVERLVAEARRLRSDEWLAKAALEIESSWPTTSLSKTLSILRKHRDGKV